MRRVLFALALSFWSVASFATVAVNVAIHNQHSDTSSPVTWTQTGAASSGIDGFLLGICHTGTSTDHVSAASYGGDALTRIVRNVDTAGEPGACEWWFKGVGVAQGAQTVSYTPGSTDDNFHAVSITLTAAGNTEIVDFDGVSENVANPSVTLNYSSRMSMAFALLHSGHDALASFTPNGNTSTVDNQDSGGNTWWALRQTTAGSSDFAIGGTSTTEDVAFAALAVSEVASAAPTFTAGPTLGSMTTTTAPTTFTTDQTATVYGVACPNGQTLPTVSQILVQDCTGDINAVSSWTEATVATVSDAHTFTGLTAGTVYDLAFVVNNGNGSSARSTIADATTTAGSTPTFDSGPTVSSQTASAYTITYDASANAVTLFCGAYLKDATTPTGAQIEAGTNAHGTATEATTGSSDTIVLTPSESDKFPVYDPHCVLENANGYSGVFPMPDEFLDAPAGRQYVIKAGAPAVGQLGILDGASPAAVDGDVMDAATHADSFALGAAIHAITLNPDTTYVIDSASDTSRHKFTRRFYDVSISAWSDASPALYCVNNNFPAWVGLPISEGEDPFLLERDVAVTITLDDLYSDAEDDALTHEVDNIPVGGSEDGEELEGPFTDYGVFTTPEFRAFDICDDFVEQVQTITIGLRLPDLTAWLLDESLWRTHSIFATLSLQRAMK